MDTLQAVHFLGKRKSVLEKMKTKSNEDRTLLNIQNANGNSLFSIRKRGRKSLFFIKCSTGIHWG